MEYWAYIRNHKTGKSELKLILDTEAEFPDGSSFSTFENYSKGFTIKWHKKNKENNEDEDHEE
jgi:hypothetical protein